MKQNYVYDPEHKAPFTKEVALGLQEDCLNKWSLVLNAEAMSYLRIVVAARNKALEEIENINPYNVCRGQDLDSIVHGLYERLFREACITTKKEEGLI